MIHIRLGGAPKGRIPGDSREPLAATPGACVSDDQRCYKEAMTPLRDIDIILQSYLNTNLYQLSMRNKNINSNHDHKN